MLQEVTEAVISCLLTCHFSAKHPKLHSVNAITVYCVLCGGLVVMSKMVQCCLYKVQVLIVYIQVQKVYISLLAFPSTTDWRISWETRLHD